MDIINDNQQNRASENPNSEFSGNQETGEWISSEYTEPIHYTVSKLMSQIWHQEIPADVEVATDIRSHYRKQFMVFDQCLISLYGAASVGK